LSKARTNADNVTADIAGITAGTGITGGGTSGTVTISADTAVVATTSNTITLSNKTIALGSNTVSGTTAEFNSALTDGDFATIAGSETLTNKTIAATSNTLTGVINNTLTTTTGDIIYASAANTPARLGIGSNGTYLTSNGSVPSWGTVSSAMTFVGTQTATNGGITFSGIPTHKSLRMYVSQVNGSSTPAITQMRVNGLSTNTYGTIQNTYFSGTAPYAQYQNPAGGSIWSQQDSAFSLGSVQSGAGNFHYVIDFINSGFSTTNKFITVITHSQGNTGTLFPTQAYLVQSTSGLVVTSIAFGTNWTGTGSLRADLFALN